MRSSLREIELWLSGAVAWTCHRTTLQIISEKQNISLHDYEFCYVMLFLGEDNAKLQKLMIV